MTYLVLLAWLLCGAISALCAKESWARRYPNLKGDWADNVVWLMAIGGPVSLATAWFSFVIEFGDKKFGHFLFRRTDETK